jgi:phage-related tail protein
MPPTRPGTAVAALRAKYAPKLAVLEERLRKAEQALEKEQQQASQAKMQTGLSIATTVLGAFLGKGFMTKSTMTSAGSAARTFGRQAREGQDVARAEENIGAVQAQIEELQQKLQEESLTIAAQYDTLNEVFETTVINPKKTNIQVKLCALCWRA